VPLSLLSVQIDTEIAVIEMGANHPGEIAELCNLAEPHYGIITNIGKAHLEGFGSFEGVIGAKSELYSFIRKNNGLVFVNHDDPLLMELSDGINRVSYGASLASDIKGKITGREPYLSLSWQKDSENGRIKTALFGDYNFSNIMAALAAGLFFHVKPDAIEKAIESYIPENNRSQRIRSQHNMIILDAYNANPSSMRAALRNFSQVRAENKMVILGDMMELGNFSAMEHQDIVSLARELSFQAILLIGNHFSDAVKDDKILCFPGTDEAETWIRDHPVRNMMILIKGSRKMQLEKLAGLL
jgi:UDP-N-acetylmuramoyl-tripeptide--D-alanyl-D-alanine ligase